MSGTDQWTDFVDTTASVEHERLALMEQIFDPYSVRNLDRIGVAEGWQCLEVGAGAGSVARAMADRAGAGNVVATDLAVELLAPLAELGVTGTRSAFGDTASPPGIRLGAAHRVGAGTDRRGCSRPGPIS